MPQPKLANPPASSAKPFRTPRDHPFGPRPLPVAAQSQTSSPLAPSRWPQISRRPISRPQDTAPPNSTVAPPLSRWPKPGPLFRLPPATNNPASPPPLLLRPEFRSETRTNPPGPAATQSLFRPRENAIRPHPQSAHSARARPESISGTPAPVVPRSRQIPFSSDRPAS